MKKKLLRTAFLILLMLPAIAFAHFYVFPQETRCILIGFADFDNASNIFYRKNVSQQTIRNIEQGKSAAENAVNLFWGEQTKLDYKIIYCNTDKDFNDYGYAGSPAATQLKMGAYVVIKDESLEPDIIAHEIAHTVLYRNIGWYKTKFVIPTWFDEGLAMQVDNRNYYSLDSVYAKLNNGEVLPHIMGLNKPEQFFSGDADTIMLRYLTAKYIVYEWLKTHSLKDFITSVNNGNSFTEAYNKR